MTTSLAYLRRLRLQNVRGFRDLELTFGVEQPRMRTVIVGRNGTCKTTLLRAIALGCAERASVASLVAGQYGPWIRHGAPEGRIELGVSGIGDDGTQASRSRALVRDRVASEGVIFGLPGELEEIDSTLGSIMTWGYGVGRRDSKGEQGGEYRVSQSVKTLFDYDAPLVDSELVLRRLQSALEPARFNLVMQGLKVALGLDREGCSIEVKPGGGIEVQDPEQGGTFDVGSWADGYRMTFHWMVDFYGWALRAGAFDDQGRAQGILLIDELEQHLHPSMQREILDHLSQALPKVQIIATTHSPLVALSAKPEEIISLRRRETPDNEVVAVPVPDLSGYSVEDILVEEALFGTVPYSTETFRRMQQHDALARVPRRQRSSGQQQELVELSRQLSPVDAPALRDDPVLEELEEIKAMLTQSSGSSE